MCVLASEGHQRVRVTLCQDRAPGTLRKPHFLNLDTHSSQGSGASGCRPSARRPAHTEPCGRQPTMCRRPAAPSPRWPHPHRHRATSSTRPVPFHKPRLVLAPTPPGLLSWDLVLPVPTQLLLKSRTTAAPGTALTSRARSRRLCQAASEGSQGPHRQ